MTMFNSLFLLTIFLAFSAGQKSVKQVLNAKWFSVKPSQMPAIKTLPFPNSEFRYIVRGDQANNEFVIFEGTYATEGPGLHVHTREEELFQVMEGNVQFIVDGVQFCAYPGDYVFVPRNVTQGTRIHDGFIPKKPVRIQIQLHPGGLENFLDDMAPLYNGQQLNFELQERISNKYGVYTLGNVNWRDLGCFREERSTSNSASSMSELFPNIFRYIKSFF